MIDDKEKLSRVEMLCMNTNTTDSEHVIKTLKSILELVRSIKRKMK